jgi:hypothetical protein
MTVALKHHLLFLFPVYKTFPMLLSTYNWARKKVHRLSTLTGLGSRESLGS